MVDGVRTYFVYSAEGLVGEYDGVGAELRTYGWAPDSQWGTDPLFVKIGSHYYWYQNDHQGTPQKIISTSGRVVWAAEYDSFGNSTITVSEVQNNLRFPGQYFDTETGLHYNLNRYYDPASGRYLRTDPFGDGLNLYAYVFNNPLILIDPRGLCAVNTIGYYLGTGLGEESAMMWADWYNETGNPIYFAGGLFASLWTPDTYIQTAFTLATAPLAAAEITVAGLRSTAAAARVAAKQVVEELIGVPVPSRPNGLLAPTSGMNLPSASRWPPNRGILGQSERYHLMPGELIDRYGFEGGKSASQLGTAFDARSLPPDYLSTKPYNAYRVLKPIEVDRGIVLPWFGQRGLGVQYDLPVSVDVLLRRGFIGRYTP